MRRWFGTALAAALFCLSLAPAGQAAPIPEFTDDFSQPDGPALQWTVAQGTAVVESGEYSLSSPPAPPPWIHEVATYAGSPPESFSGDVTLSFDVTFLANGGGPEGRHGGVLIYANTLAWRFATNSYCIWWIDRPWDRGYAIYRWDNNGTSNELLGSFGHADTDPGRHWVIDVRGDTISLTVDGVFKGSVTDNTYRSGYVGLWTYDNGQHAHFDNMAIREVPVTVGVDVKPGDAVNPINPKSRGKIPVAILSSETFDALAAVDTATLTFGRTGDEPSLAQCSSSGEDVNADGLFDLLCHFDTPPAGFEPGDAQAVLKGALVDGRPLTGKDEIVTVPSAK